MALGEYDLNDLMEGDKMYITSVGKDFTMALVVLLAILGRYILAIDIHLYPDLLYCFNIQVLNNK